MMITSSYRIQTLKRQNVTIVFRSSYLKFGSCNIHSSWSAQCWWWQICTKRARDLWGRNPSQTCWEIMHCKKIFTFCSVWRDTESSFHGDMETEQKMEPTTYFSTCSLRSRSLSLSLSLSPSLSLLCRYWLRISSSSLDPVFGPLLSCTVDERTVGIFSNLKGKKKEKLVCSCWSSSGVKEQQSHFIQVQKNTLLL